MIAAWTAFLWVRSYLGNSDLVAQAGEKVSAYQAAAATLPPNPIGDTDLPPVVDALNNLRDLPSNPVLNEPEPERRVRYGLYQGEVLGTQAAQTYRAALNQRFLPRILLRLEEQMAVSMNNPELLYETLKIYLMLGQQGPLNKDLVREWLETDWSVAYGGISRAPLRDDLKTHLEALLSQQMDEIALNGPLVEQVQGVLTQLPLAERVYNGIINSAAATQLPKWRITEVGGPSVARAMVRSSGKPLNDGIEGIFTYSGFNNIFLPEAVSVAERVKDEAWVLGDRGDDLQSDQALLALSRDVLDLYYSDFISRYDQMMGDLDIIPLESLSHAAEVTNILSGPTSPILNILTQVASETKLTEDRSNLDTENLQGTAKNLAQLEGRSALSPQGQLLLEALASTAVSAAQSGQPQLPPGAFVERRFSWLHDLVDRPEGQPSQLDLMLDGLLQVYLALNKMSIAGISDGDAAGQAISQFQQSASQTQGPLPRWASQITTGSSGLATEGTRATINANWQANVLPFCTQALDNRYPFNKRARADVGLQDFTKLFGPGGLMDTFFKEQLQKHVDTTARPWTFKRVNNVDLGISPAVLQQFQHAAEIKDAFFAAGPQMSVSFQVTAFALDPKAKSVVLDSHGQQLTYEQNGPQNPVAFTWPGNIGLAQITFSPNRKDTENVMKRDGPWAWFRLLDAAEVRSTSASDRKRVFFKVGGRAAIFDMQTGSFLNPFALPALSKFSCPKSM
jgi:type VI secretion system protein ImpL